MSDTDRREITQLIRWVPVGDPVGCVHCGHTHSPRAQQSDDWGPYTRFAPQWSFCDQDGCDCHSLYRSGVPIGNSLGCSRG